MNDTTIRTNGRRCGSCSLCCRLLNIAEFNSPPGKLCPHARQAAEGAPGCCSIHDDPNKPTGCGAFECLWLQDQTGIMPASFRPDRVGVVVGTNKDGNSLALYCPPERPDAYKAGKFGQWINRLTLRGVVVFVIAGDRRKLVRTVFDTPAPKRGKGAA